MIGRLDSVEISRSDEAHVGREAHGCRLHLYLYRRSVAQEQLCRRSNSTPLNICSVVDVTPTSHRGIPEDSEISQTTPLTFHRRGTGKRTTNQNRNPHPLFVPQVQQIPAELSHLLLQLQPVRGVSLANRVRHSSLPEASRKRARVATSGKSVGPQIPPNIKRLSQPEHRKTKPPALTDRTSAPTTVYTHTHTHRR